MLESWKLAGPWEVEPRSNISLHNYAEWVRLRHSVSTSGSHGAIFPSFRVFLTLPVSLALIFTCDFLRVPPDSSLAFPEPDLILGCRLEFAEFLLFCKRWEEIHFCTWGFRGGSSPFTVRNTWFATAINLHPPLPQSLSPHPKQALQAGRRSRPG